MVNYFQAAEYGALTLSSSCLFTELCFVLATIRVTFMNVMLLDLKPTGWTHCSVLGSGWVPPADCKMADDKHESS